MQVNNSIIYQHSNNNLYYNYIYHKIDNNATIIII